MINVKHALLGVGQSVKLEIMTLKVMRENGKSFGELIDWILASHLHFFLTHPHQGFESKDESSVAICAEFDHAGVPFGPKVYCPIMRQDKHRYLRDLGPGMTLRTLQISLEEEVEVQTEHTGARFERFIAQFPTIYSDIIK